MDPRRGTSGRDESVQIAAGDVTLEGSLEGLEGARGVVLFAHGSGSGRHSPRNRAVAAALRQGGLGTLLFDLLTADEETEDLRTRELRFDIPFLASRLQIAATWLRTLPEAQRLDLGYFGASTGAAAALAAAAAESELVQAVVSRGGRPDLAGEALERVRAPTLLIVGGRDEQVLELNRQAFDRLRTHKELEVVEGATHLFEEPGALDRVADLARDWFVTHLGR